MAQASTPAEIQPAAAPEAVSCTETTPARTLAPSTAGSSAAPVSPQQPAPSSTAKWRPQEATPQPVDYSQPDAGDELLDYEVPILTRRHSVPASYVFNTFLSLWNANGGEGSSSSMQQQQQENEQQVPHTNSNQQEAADRQAPSPRKSATGDPGKNIRGTSAGEACTHSSADNDQPQPTSSNSSPAGKGNVNRHRYGHRHTKSAVLDQPVIVKTYDPKLNSARMNGRLLNGDDEYEKVKLPPVDAFSFNGLMKAIKPQMDNARDSLSNFSSRYRENLKTETDVLERQQVGINEQIREADILTARVLKVSNERNDQVASDLKQLKEGSAIEELAQCAERTYTALESVISTLIAIDEMLPTQDRLAFVDSMHRHRYPNLNQMLVRKSKEINRRFSQYGRRASMRSEAPPALQTPTTPVTPSYYKAPQTPRSPFINYPGPSYANRRFSTASSMNSPLSPSVNLLPPQLVRAASPTQSPTTTPHLELPRLVRSSTFSHTGIADVRPRTSTVDLRPPPQPNLNKRRTTFANGISGWWNQRPWSRGETLAVPVEEESAEEKLRKLIEKQSSLSPKKGKGKAANRRSVAF